MLPSGRGTSLQRHKQTVRTRFRLCVLTHRCLSSKASRRPARSSIDARRPGFPCRCSTGPCGTVCRRPSKLHCQFSLSDDSSRHFCSGLTDLTFAMQCFCDSVTIIRTCNNNNNNNEKHTCHQATYVIKVSFFSLKMKHITKFVCQH